MSVVNISNPHRNIANRTDLPHEGAAVLVVDLHAVVGRIRDEAVVLVDRHAERRLQLVLRHAGVGQRLHEAAARLLEHLILHTERKKCEEEKGRG